IMEPLAASTRRSLEILKRASSVVSILLSVFSIYLIRKHSARATSTSYKTLLMGVVVTAQFNDFYLETLFEPVFLFPFPCIYTEGLLYRRFDVETTTTLAAWIQVMNAMTFPYMFCVIYRNQ
ncbi:hypothetical protein PFISCL1PPCAC_13784, partial [Pristionchus fissidentatus]